MCALASPAAPRGRRRGGQGWLLVGPWRWVRAAPPVQGAQLALGRRAQSCRRSAVGVVVARLGGKHRHLRRGFARVQPSAADRARAFPRGPTPRRAVRLEFHVLSAKRNF